MSFRWIGFGGRTAGSTAITISIAIGSIGSSIRIGRIGRTYHMTYDI